MYHHCSPINILSLLLFLLHFANANSAVPSV
jgi:hypothetical protein